MLSKNFLKNNASNIILFLFLLLTTSTLYLSHLFTPNNVNSQNPLLIANFLEAKDAPFISEIVITNKEGEFVFNRDLNTPKTWKLIKPKEILVDDKIIFGLLDFLQNIKIKKTLPSDKNNISNFNLAPPLAQIKYKYLDKENLILFGLLNTIDKSIYTKSYNSNEIYHVDSPEFDFENAKLIDFLVTNIFQLKGFNQISIFNTNQIKADLEVTFNENKWVDSLKNVYNSSKINDLIEKANKLKAHFVFENPNDSQMKFIENQIKKTAFKISLKDSLDPTKESVFLISSDVTQFPGIELQNEKFVIVKSSNSKYFYLFKSSEMEIFQLKNSDLVKEN